MALGVDALCDFWIALRYPAQHKEGSSNVVLVENPKQMVSVGAYAGFVSIPVGATDSFLKRCDLKVVFYVDGKCTV